MAEKKKKRIRHMGKVCFAIYVTVALHFLFFSDYLDRTMLSDEWRYNLTPFAEIRRFWVCREQLGLSTYLNIVGNVVCFIPFGFLLPVMTKKKFFHNVFFVVLCTALFSFGIEMIQMLTRVGAFDVDDIILNSIGGLVGYICMVIMKKTYKNMMTV